MATPIRNGDIDDQNVVSAIPRELLPATSMSVEEYRRDRARREAAGEVIGIPGQESYAWGSVTGP